MPGNPLQRSTEWHEARRGRITCSRIGAVLGIDPYCTPKKYWEELVGLREPFAGNIATDYGTAHEEAAIRAYEVHTGVLVDRRGFVCHPSIEWLGGSPDGLAEDVLLEVKCPYRQTIPFAEPVAHWAQVQGLLQVLDLQIGHLWFWTPSEQRCFEIRRDDNWWDVNALPALTDFWTKVRTKEWKDERQVRHGRRAVQERPQGTAGATGLHRQPDDRGQAVAPGRLDQGGAEGQVHVAEGLGAAGAEAGPADAPAGRG